MAPAENAVRREKKRTDPEKRQRIYKRNGMMERRAFCDACRKESERGTSVTVRRSFCFFDILIKQPERPPRGGHMPLCRLLAARGGTAYTSLYQLYPCLPCSYSSAPGLVCHMQDRSYFGEKKCVQM